MPSVARPGGVSVYYEAEGSGPAVTLAHGFGVSLEMWDPQRGPLSERHHLVLWDARGHGYSGAPRDAEAYTMPLFAEDLRAVLAVEGVVSAHRFRYADIDNVSPPYRYMAVYEWESESVETARAALTRAREAGLVPMSETVDTTTVGAWFFEAMAPVRERNG